MVRVKVVVGAALLSRCTAADMEPSPGAPGMLGYLMDSKVLLSSSAWLVPGGEPLAQQSFSGFR
jgi:hypothetical protein